MSEAPPAGLPKLEQAGQWVGSTLDDVKGRAVGQVAGVYADTEGRGPAWLVVAVGRGRRRLPFGRRATKSVAVPLRECAAMPGRVWTAQERQAVRNAPSIDPARSLLREHELTICLHYGIGEQVGRHAEVAARTARSITAQPV